MKFLSKLTAVFLIFLSSAGLAGELEKNNKDLVLNALAKVFDAQKTELIETYYHPQYIQHSPEIKDGVDGLSEAITQMRDNGITVAREVVRVVAQDNLVATQSRVTIGAHTMIVGDLFRIQDGKIIEHWDASQVETPKSKTANGNSMIDGGGNPNADVSEADLARNKEMATDFFAKGIAGDVATLKRLFGEEYIQHNPQVPNGIEPILGFFKNSDGKLSNVTVHQTVSEGDLTFALVEYADWGNAVIEIVRHDDEGKIVEHWDMVQEIPKDFSHENGMF